MEISKQVVSLELAKKLKELGVKQESLFYWTYSNISGHVTYYLQYFPEVEGGYDMEDTEDLSAFTVAELGEMLPSEVKFFTGIKVKKRRANAQHIHFFKGRNWCVNYTGGGARENYTQHAETEADARAKMLIYLIENKLITH